MHSPRDDTLTLKHQVLEAHELYLGSLARVERIESHIRDERETSTAPDLLLAEIELDRNRRTLRDLLDRLGYLPEGMGIERPGIDHSP